jgi:LPXTG-motif cell wall-anchored protein
MVIGAMFTDVLAKAKLVAASAEGAAAQRASDLHSMLIPVARATGPGGLGPIGPSNPIAPAPAALPGVHATLQDTQKSGMSQTTMLAIGGGAAVLLLGALVVLKKKKKK